MSVLISVCFVLKFSFSSNVAVWNQFANDFGECWLISDGYGQVNTNENFFRKMVCIIKTGMTTNEGLSLCKMCA